MELHKILRTERKKRFSMEEVASTFKEWGIDCSSSTLSRVENGAIPSWPIVDGYCKLFGWSLADLEKRLGRSSAVEPVDITAPTRKRHISPTLGREIPIVSWVNAGGWAESPCIDSYNQETKFVTGKMPRNTFCLTVSGNSMENCETKESFPNGSLILVNPDKEPEIGDYVVAVDEATQEATFKQLLEDCGKKKLVPLNPQYQVMDVTETTVIKGVVFRNVIDKRV
ncbi:XRE family transcriptional regulator, partial [Vibrio sp. S9_S30]|uniref:helix-turn-helix domain-containing protein n=1 Tax=Vibrio sp. S9_S30 TaxID=2720226 RepID=UPI0016810B50